MFLEGKKTLVAGLGKSGMATLRYLNDNGIEAAGYDMRLDDAKREALALEFPKMCFYSEDVAEALRHGEFDAVSLSPGIPPRGETLRRFRDKGGILTNDVEILCDLCRGKRNKIVAVTGSNGKTTTTSLVGEMLRFAGKDVVVAGNIGYPVLDAFASRKGKTPDAWVLELSSFQLESVRELGADAAACLNISQDHMDRYDDLLDYARSKDMIFNGAKAQVLNLDDPLCRIMRRKAGDAAWFSLRPGLGAEAEFDEGWLSVRGRRLLQASELKLAGTHNVANVLAAVLLAQSAGVDPEVSAQAAREFKPLEHRVEKIGEKGGVLFYDDSKGTNVGATAAAIAGATAPVLLIAGGDGKGQDYSPLADAAKGKVKKAFLIGRDGPQVGRALQGAVPLQSCDDLQDAVSAAYRFADPGDWVLLSPACASWDMFDDYAHRSRVFCEAFEALPER